MAQVLRPGCFRGRPCAQLGACLSWSSVTHPPADRVRGRDGGWDGDSLRASGDLACVKGVAQP